MGRTEVKKLSEEKAVGEMLCWGGRRGAGGGGGGMGREREGEGGVEREAGGVRACVHAPFDLPAYCLTSTSTGYGTIKDKV
jgi:hypothetical protein